MESVTFLRKKNILQMDSEALQKQFRITYTADLRTKACDILRDLLPASTLTNVGLFGNGRYYQNLLTRLYSQELPESSRRAADAHAELNKVIPKFVKRAKRDEYSAQVERQMRVFTAELLHGIIPPHEDSCVLLPLLSSSQDLLGSYFGLKSLRLLQASPPAIIGYSTTIII